RPRRPRAHPPRSALAPGFDPAPGFNRQLLPLRPLGPGPGVNQHVRVAQQKPESEEQVTRLGGAVAGEDESPTERDALSKVACAERLRRLPHPAEPLLAQIVLPVMVDGPRNVATPHLRAGLTRELVRRPRINEQRVVQLQRAPNVLQRGGLRAKAPG